MMILRDFNGYSNIFFKKDHSCVGIFSDILFYHGKLSSTIGTVIWCSLLHTGEANPSILLLLFPSTFLIFPCLRFLQFWQINDNSLTNVSILSFLYLLLNNIEKYLQVGMAFHMRDQVSKASCLLGRKEEVLGIFKRNNEVLLVD